MKAAARPAHAYWLVLAAQVAIAFLWRPRLTMPGRGGMETSWQHAMNRIAVDGLAFGKDVIYTFGPLARVYTSYYNPRLFAMHCLVAAWLAVLYVWLLHRLLSVSFERGWVKAGLMFLMVPLVGTADVFWYSFAPLGLLAILVHRRPRDEAFESCFWLGLALLSLIKSSFAVSSAFLWLAEVGVCVATRRLRWPLLVFPVGGLAIWIGQGQSPLNLPLFVKNTLAIASGYGDAMGRKLLGASLIWGFWLTFACSAVLLYYSLRNEPSRLRRIVPVLIYLGLGALLFKGCFVNSYQDTAASAVLMMTGFVLLAGWRSSSATRFGRAWSGLCVVVALVSSNQMSTLYMEQNVLSFEVDRAKATAQLVAQNFADLRAGGLEDAYYRAWARVRKKSRLPALKGSVDVYRVNQILVSAYDLKWSPRLVFQSFAAYTPALIEQNRQHLLGASRPDAIIMELATVDHRYPMLDDGISLLEILSRYSPASLVKRMVIFERRPKPNPYRFSQQRTIRAKFDTLVEVPGNETKLLWVSLDFEKSLAGRASALYRAPFVYMNVLLATGSGVRYRMIPNMSGAGFLLSPLVNSPIEYAFLNDESSYRAPPSAQVVGISFSIEPGLEWMYENSILVKLSEVEFESLDHAEAFTPEEIAARTAGSWRKRRR